MGGKSQKGFLDFVCTPLFEVIYDFQLESHRESDKLADEATSESVPVEPSIITDQANQDDAGTASVTSVDAISRRKSTRRVTVERKESRQRTAEDLVIKEAASISERLKADLLE